MLRLSLAVAAVAAVIFGGVLASGGDADAGNALGGPVIIGGDDLTDHGCVDGAGDPIQGWLYMQRALENIGPNVTRAGNNGSIAALGSADPGGTICSNAGSAIAVAAGKVGRSVTFYDGAAAINGFFADLAGGTANPAIIWIAGTGAANDLSGDEPAALVTNATAISNFVNSGGGLFSHGSEFGWLSALLPTVTDVCCGSSGDLYFTPDGLAELSPLTVSDINAGPWHNHFEGNFGGLKVLVRSENVTDSQGNDAAVVLGGSTVTIVEQPTTVPQDPAGDNCIPALPTHSCGGQPGGGVSDATAVPPGEPEPAPTQPPLVDETLGATPPTGVIQAPGTGTGGPSSGGSSLALIALIVAGVAGIAGTTMAAAAWRRS